MLPVLALALAASVRAQSSSSSSSASATSAAATTSLTPLYTKNISYSEIPYQVSGTDAGPRGPQSGYNQCNSTTQNQDSLCQTLIVNSLLDFCIWSSPKTSDTIAESEAYEVAWCTKDGHGTRITPEATFTGLQLLYAKDYIQIAGWLDQTKVNLQASDYGGELDPHGDDQQGNPLGGIVYSNGFGMNSASFNALMTTQDEIPSAAENNSITQVHEWTQFIGDGMICLKICNPASGETLAASLCQHIYDEVGCYYNAPALYSEINGTFTVCDADDMIPIGTYTVDGTQSVWKQGYSGIQTPPYSPSVVASSNCYTYSSEQLFNTLFGTGTYATTTASSTGSASTGKTGGSGTESSSGAGSTSSSSAGSSGAVSTTAAAPLTLMAALLGCAFLAPLLML